MTQEEVYRHLFAHNPHSMGLASTTILTNYPHRICELACRGVKYFQTTDVSNFQHMLSHPSLREYTVDRVKVGDNCVTVVLFGVTLCCLTGGK